MPTNSKTSLGLNSWQGTDKPKRSDFVQDNTLLDSLLTGHFNDASKHLSADDRTLLTQGYVTGTYTGNGSATQVITLPFAAKVVAVFTLRKPAVVYRTTGNYTENNFAVITQQGSMAGLLLNGTSLTVCQTVNPPVAGGILHNLNSANDSYVYIAFR